VTRGTYDELQTQNEQVVAERDRLNGEVKRLKLERDSFEKQYIDAQNAYEDERIARNDLEQQLSQTENKAKRLDHDLGAERIARMEAAEALALKETQIAAMQSTYDELVGDLESEVSSGQIEIQRLREGLRLNVSDEVLFASGSAKLDRPGREVLVKVAGRLKELEDMVTVRGHTDNLPIRGSLAKIYPSNWELAAARAASVVRLLQDQGISGDRLLVVSVGPNEPIAPNDTPANRARNRRIEIRLEPRPKAESAPKN
jgi:chemotaxis protein MotB